MSQSRVFISVGTTRGQGIIRVVFVVVVVVVVVVIFFDILIFLEDFSSK